MAKKNKDDTPNPNSIPNRDIMQRLNFLYQASSYLNGLGFVHGVSGPSNVAIHSKTEDVENRKECPSSAKTKEMANGTRKWAGQRTATAHDVARSYVKSMKIIGQKTNVKMDPSIKRTMCKGCNMLLMPGVTAKVRVKPLPSHGHVVSYTCMNCSFSRRIPAPPTTEQIARPVQDSTETTQDMQVDPVDQLLDSVKEEVSAGPMAHDGKGKEPELRKQNRKKKRVKPRPLPFFERAEHFILVGNDRVDRTREDREPH
ncbi:Rpr2-domain-containing protein [Sanghuangporus baumii]|uniref:Rpr2-domain-containing protein n=1 Tax=Sanghuangporus baumii TaxID=108892 RepID=A0A9Q5N7F7_SANBA|nr:Rpr2-domain-containing protein [Sanghuangporus baumii]